MISRSGPAFKLKQVPFLKETTMVRYSISTLPILALMCLWHPLAARTDTHSALPRPPWVSMADQKANDPRLAGYSTPAEVRLELVPDSPMVAMAGQIAFDPDGSLWVLNWLANDPKKLISDYPALQKKVGGKTRLEDSIAVLNGWASKQDSLGPATVLKEEFVSAMLLAGDYLYIVSNGTIQRRSRIQKAGKFEKPKSIATGFGGLGPRPSCGLSFDLTGSLIIAVGPGNHHVTGSDGSTADALGTGAVFRCRPDGSKMELLATGLSNPDGAVVFDRDFNAFLAETSPGQNASTTNILHITEGSDFGFRSSKKSRPELEDFAKIMSPRLARSDEANRLDAGQSIRRDVHLQRQPVSAIFPGVVALPMPGHALGESVPSRPPRFRLRRFRSVQPSQLNRSGFQTLAGPHRSGRRYLRIGQRRPQPDHEGGEKKWKPPVSTLVERREEPPGDSIKEKF